MKPSDLSAIASSFELSTTAHLSEANELFAPKPYGDPSQDHRTRVLLQAMVGAESQFKLNSRGAFKLDDLLTLLPKAKRDDVEEALGSLAKHGFLELEGELSLKTGSILGVIPFPEPYCNVTDIILKDSAREFVRALVSGR